MKKALLYPYYITLLLKRKKKRNIFGVEISQEGQKFQAKVYLYNRFESIAEGISPEDSFKNLLKYLEKAGYVPKLLNPNFFCNIDEHIIMQEVECKAKIPSLR